MVSWRPPRARRYAEPNRPLAPPPTKMASYSRSSSSGVATFHRPSVFSSRVGDDVVDQQSPLAHGKRSTGRSPVPAGERAQGADAGAKRREPVARISYIDHRGTSVPGARQHRVAGTMPLSPLVQHRQWRMGGAGHLRTKNRPGITPPDQGCAVADGTGRGGQDSSRSACSVPQARVASCRLKCTSGSLSSSPVRSRIRCSRYFSVLLCTESSAAVAS